MCHCGCHAVLIIGCEAMRQAKGGLSGTARCLDVVQSI